VKHIKNRLLIALSLLAPLGGFLLVFFHSSIIPILFRWAASYVSPDGNLEEKTVQHFVKAISNNTIPLVLLSFIPPLLVIAGEFLSKKLPERNASVEPEQELPIERREWMLVLLVLSIALILRIPALLHSLDDDEIVMVTRFIKVPLIQTLTTFKLHNHIGYSLVARLCYKLFGDADWIVRLPSLLLGIGTIYQLWLLARKYVDHKIAIASALFLAVLPFHVQYSTRARGYASMTFFMLLSSRYFLELLQKKNFSKSLMFVLSSATGIYFHLCGTFPLVSQFFFFVVVLMQFRFSKDELWSDRECLVNLWFCFSAIGLLSLLLYSPVLLNLLNTVEVHGRGPIYPPFVVFVLMRFFGNLPLGIVNLVLLIAGFVFLFRSRKLFAFYLLSMIILPLIGLILISPADLVARLLFFEVPYVCLLCASGFSFLYSWINQRTTGIIWLRAVPLGVIALMLCFQAKLSWKDTPQIAFREAVKMMNENASPQTAVCATGYGAEYYQYYSSRPIQILKSKEEFDKLLPEYKEVRCAYIFTTWTTADDELISFLDHNARVRHTPGIKIFIYENRKNRSNHG
jgi:hypothetical protein